MQEIFIVGIIHGGSTPKDELEEILENIKPNQILIELPQKNITELLASKDIRDEMMFAYKWAKKNNISVDLFDEDVNLFRDGESEESSKFKKLKKEIENTIKKYSWKDLNMQENYHVFNYPLLWEVDDIDKSKKEMLKCSKILKIL